MATLWPKTGERLIKRRPPYAALVAKVAPCRLEEYLSWAFTPWFGMSETHITKSKIAADELICFMSVTGLNFYS